MHIDRNDSAMQAGVTASADKTGRQVCVVVVKGTFSIQTDGGTRLAEVQVPPVPCDVPWGDPQATGMRYECDFALRKPAVDLIVNGQAHAPGARAVTSVGVAFEVGAVRKSFMVFGDRRWETSLLGTRISDPEPFLTKPLHWHRAFGGVDQSNPDPAKHGAELRNLVGTGYVHGRRAPPEGLRLPNVENPRALISSASDRPDPWGCGVVGRAWQPRASRAGTYDDGWRDERCPLLPLDFDDQYFQAAPDDQRLASTDGLVFRCLNMTPDGKLAFKLPRAQVTIVFRKNGGREKADGMLDTVIVEPDERRVLMVWRASAPLGRKMTSLRGVEIDAAVQS
jgi:hypothetical protein